MNISHDCLERKTENYGLNKTSKIAKYNSVTLDQILNLTIKVYSSLSIVNKNYYLKFRIKMCHRQFFRIKSKNPDYVQKFCNDRNNSFHFSIHKWYSDNQSPKKFYVLV